MNGARVVDGIKIMTNNIGKRVEVYWNLHKKIWSVRHKGKVLGHNELVIIGNPEFAVQPAGRERVLREKRKNVHAFVRGELLPSPVCVSHPLFLPAGWVEVTYNPYKYSTFVEKTTKKPIHNADKAILVEKKAWALSVTTMEMVYNLEHAHI